MSGEFHFGSYQSNIMKLKSNISFFKNDSADKTIPTWYDTGCIRFYNFNLEHFSVWCIVN